MLITGCDTGFGNLTAKRLHAMGVKVFAGCLTTAGCESLTKECASDSNSTSKHGVVAFPLDVTKEESVQKAAELVKKELGNSQLWGVVNNA